jgi:hypothetical protein
VTGGAQQWFDDTERSAMMDQHDLLEVLLDIADELDVAVGKRPGCEFCRAESNRAAGGFDCPDCLLPVAARRRWCGPLGRGGAP